MEIKIQTGLSHKPRTSQNGGQAEWAITQWQQRLFENTERGAQWREQQETLDRLRFHVALRRRWPQARAEVAIQGAAASAKLAGARITVDELHELLLRTPSSIEKPSDPVEALAIRQWQAWAYAIQQWPELGQAHAQLRGSYQHLVPTCAAIANGEQITAPGPGLQAALACCEGTSAGVVRSGIVMAEVVCGGGSAIAALIAQTLLVTSFVDPTGLCTPVVQLARDPLGYRAALQRYRKGDVAGWLEYWCDAVSAAVGPAVTLADAVLAGSRQRLEQCRDSRNTP